MTRTTHNAFPSWLTALACLAVVGTGPAAEAQPKPQPTLKIGVTLHPYYSWTKNVVGRRASGLGLRAWSRALR